MRKRERQLMTDQKQLAAQLQAIQSRERESQQARTGAPPAAAPFQPHTHVIQHRHARRCLLPAAVLVNLCVTWRSKTRVSSPRCWTAKRKLQRCRLTLHRRANNKR